MTLPPVREGFAALVLPHLDAAATLARWLMRDAAAADDVVQDAMLRALRFHEGFRGENARGWVLRIVRNVAWQALKDRRSQPEVSDAERGMEDIADRSPSPETVVASMQDLQRVRETLDSMPAELRECLVLRELEELSYKEIARITDVPVGTVMSRLWRARQIMMQAREQVA